MLTRVLVQVDQLGGLLSGGDCCIDNAIGFGYESDDGAVMIGVRLVVEQDGSGNRFDGGDYLIDDFGAPAFAEIWNALDYLSQN